MDTPFIRLYEEIAYEGRPTPLMMLFHADAAIREGAFLDYSVADATCARSGSLTATFIWQGISVSKSDFGSIKKSRSGCFAG